jgi:CspA family cold shock protein
VPTTFAIIDGASLNRALKLNAHLDPFGCKSRLHIDYSKLKVYLESLAAGKCLDYLHYYTATKNQEIPPESCELPPPDTASLKGRVTAFSRGWGFIRGDNEQDYFAHHTEIEGSGFKNLVPGQWVSFEPVATGKGYKATRIRHKGLSQNQHSGRKRSFIEGLEAVGYSTKVGNATSTSNIYKKTLSMMMPDILMGAFAKIYDELLIYTDDEDFHALIHAVKNLNIRVKLVTFSGSSLEGIPEEAYRLNDAIPHIISDHKFLEKSA